MASLKRSTRKIVVALVGFLTLLIGIVLLALPGPGIVVIILGLFILSTEFEWAKDYLEKAKSAQKKAIEKAKAKKNNKNSG
jgi:tellurite resistance protein TerC/cation:H+ antiporter